MIIKVQLHNHEQDLQNNSSYKGYALKKETLN